MSHLRRKIEEHPSTPRYVVTDPGVGYRFVTRPE
jgi:two-component system KDP operon response regulator KdpE